jgi:hypothetical protein
MLEMETAHQSDFRMENQSKSISQFIRNKKIYFLILSKNNCIQQKQFLRITLIKTCSVFSSIFSFFFFSLLFFSLLLFFTSLLLALLKQYDFHRFGAFYAYNASTSTFEFYKGEELKKANEERRPVEYPKTVHLIEETHPEIFSANGSHGHWASAGEKLICETFSCHLSMPSNEKI